METIKLRTPLKVNGKEVRSLKYDMEAISPDAFTRAETRANEKRGLTGTPSPMVEVDYTFHLYLAFEGVKAADQTIDDSDLDRLRGSDVAALMKVGRFFIIGAGADSQDESSEAPSESTATSTDATRTK